MRRQRAEKDGRRAELWVSTWLRLKGWKLLAQRVKTPRGEIDLIMRRSGIVAFIEVKWRKRREDLDNAIDAYRLQRVAAAVECVAHDYVRQGEDVRVDVVLLAPGVMPRHIVNAWQP